MIKAILGAVLALGALVVVLAGGFPLAEVGVLADRVWPILLFVVGVTIVAKLSAEAGVFAWLGGAIARAADHRPVVLFTLVCAFAVASTVFLSLDTTAVLVTPVAIAIARRARLDPLPYAMATVWLANTASLLLPVSNLTNLLAQERLGLTPLAFASLTAAPAAIAVLVPIAILVVMFRRGLFSPDRTEIDPAGSALPDSSTQPGLRLASGCVIAALLPALVSGIPVWIPAMVAAIALLAMFARFRPESLRLSLIPWQLVVFAGGLFLAVGAMTSLGLDALLTSVAGTGTGTASLLRLAGIGAFSANAMNNLPAYLALEPLAHDPLRTVALLIGVNVGPLVTPWACLATLLWHDRLTDAGVGIRWGRFMLLGLLAAPVTVVAATLAVGSA